ncbi:MULTISPECIES: DUF805 domain-containing protein [Arthrobacter]|uniref:DUF805 domain-containing protein n=1 Tax=Arthrobacter TaxID=1663 RepID=UPI001AB015B6|nr:MULTISPECIES: DUF805 domain-containing protein [Arthrobacter]QTF72120.1 DUF805 domain-containing protein [Arthrobacter woluwensis]
MTQQPDWQNNNNGGQPQQPPQAPQYGQQPPQAPPYGAPQAPQAPQYGQQQSYGQQGYQQQPASPYGQPAYSGGLYPPYVPRPSVGFTQAIKMGFANYANFKGRASRSEFWWWYLFQAVVAAIPAILGYALFAGGLLSQTAVYDSGYSSSASDVTFTGGMVFGVILMIIGGIISLALLVPFIAVAWRRLHDAGFPGPMFFLSLIPYVGGIILIVLCAMPSKPEGMKYEIQ